MKMYILNWERHFATEDSMLSMHRNLVGKDIPMHRSSNMLSNKNDV